MANICDNELHVTCSEEDLDIIEHFMKDHFVCSISIKEKDGDYSQFECYFDSRWNFPEDTMNEMINKLKHPDVFYGSCLSVEWGNYYCAFHSGDENGWVYQ